MVQRVRHKGEAGGVQRGGGYIMPCPTESSKRRWLLNRARMIRRVSTDLSIDRREGKRKRDRMFQTSKHLMENSE